MSISVLICTHNRPRSLRRTLESLLCPTNLEAGDWEILVVMHYDATGATVRICQEFQAKFSGRFRFLIQKGRGKSNSLNLGIASARGEILAMTDDDVLCAPDYIRSIQSVFSRYSADGAQGRVLLDCEGGLPKWMSHDLAGFIGRQDYGDEVREWNANMSGANMVVRAEAARAVGGFAPELGAGAVGFAEDSEFSVRLRRAGYRLIYAPQIVVRHQLHREGLTKSFFRKRYFRRGRSYAYYRPLEVPVPLWRFGLYVAKDWVLSEAEALWHLCADRPAEALLRQCQARVQAGFFWQHWRFQHGTSRQLSRITSWPPPEQGSDGVSGLKGKVQDHDLEGECLPAERLVTATPGKEAGQE